MKIISDSVILCAMLTSGDIILPRITRIEFGSLRKLLHIQKPHLLFKRLAIDSGKGSEKKKKRKNKLKFLIHSMDKGFIFHSPFAVM